MWPRVLIAAVLSAGFLFAWQKLDRIYIQVVGQPSVTGVVQRQEQAFFEHLAADTGLPLVVSYTPNDQLGVKDTYQLLMLKSGALDLVSLRFLQNATTEPALLGLDLLGVTSDIRTAHALVEAYSPILDRILQKHFNSKLLGTWPFGPQVFFCGKRITGLKDLAGLKVRVGSENFEPLIASQGGIPVVMPFEDVKDSLKNGLVDCAITSATSGNAAGWPQYSTHYFGLGMQMGVNGYVVNLDLWNRLSERQQALLESKLKEHVDSIWDSVEALHKTMSSCNVGGACSRGIQYELVNVTPSKADYQRLSDTFEQTTFKDWAEKCDRVHPGCSDDWRKAVSPVLKTPPVKSR